MKYTYLSDIFAVSLFNLTPCKGYLLNMKHKITRVNFSKFVSLYFQAQF